MNTRTTRPSIIYGTAWKNDATTHLVKKAITTGFAAIDTANQPKHYSEILVGKALTELQQQGLRRESLFLQTKFTPLNGHDHRIPYDPNASIATQVQQSFGSSLEHLQTDYLDAYLIHAPYTHSGLTASDWEAWQTLEMLYDTGKITLIGISNITFSQLKLLTEQARIKPMVVQNRCFAVQLWDKAVRDFCQQQDMMYQGFSLLTANPEVLHSTLIHSIATRLDKTPEQVVLRFAQQIGMTPLSGTCNEFHMQDDVQLNTFDLEAQEIEKIETWMK